MSRTFRNAVDRAQDILNDPDGIRFTDTLMLKAANDAILTLRAKRPDLFFGTYGSLPAAEYAIGDALPVGDEIFPALVNYVVAWAEFLNDEEAMQQRAKDFYALFVGGTS